MEARRKEKEVPLCQTCAHNKRPLQDKPCKGCRENPVWRFRGEEMKWVRRDSMPSQSAHRR